MNSFLEKLTAKLNEIKNLKDQFISTTDLYHHDPMHDYDNLLILTTHVNHWGATKEGHDRIQIELRQKFKAFKEYFSLIEYLLPKKQLAEIKGANIQISNWIEKRQNAPGSNSTSAINRVNQELDIFFRIIDLLGSSDGEPERILVPDTNALIYHPELADYSTKFSNPITILIIPTVISELDKLKVNHKNEEVRKKAKSIVARLKGYKKQGDILSAGIVLSKSIIVKMLAVEPTFEKTLKWLDPENMDDRIIASILEIAISFLSSEVILITGDLNIQNKATLAGIQYIDTEELFPE